MNVNLITQMISRSFLMYIPSCFNNNYIAHERLMLPEIGSVFMPLLFNIERCTTNYYLMLFHKLLLARYMKEVKEDNNFIFDLLLFEIPTYLSLHYLHSEQ